MSGYRPPFNATPKVVSLVAGIAEALGTLSAAGTDAGRLRLRRVDRVRTIQGTLAIEGNSLGEEQITAILEGKRVLADPRAIIEVKNAMRAYDALGDYDPTERSDLLAAHGIMMDGLIDDAGSFRTKAAGVMKGHAVIHTAPPSDLVPSLVTDLLRWLKGTDDHPLIASSVFHYEFEFIHPFTDGNGRMGRLWQTLVLSRWNPVFEYIPIENVIYRGQAGYYDAINRSNASGDATAFLEFMLRAIHDAVRDAVIGSEKSSENSSEKSSEKILRLLRERPELTIAALADALSLSTRSIEKSLKRLQSEGSLRRIGPAKGGHWEVPSGR